MVPKNKEEFRDLNRQLAEKLAEFNKILGENYELEDDLQPTCYVPHVTIVHRDVLNQLAKASVVSLKSLKSEMIMKMSGQLPNQPITLKKHRYVYS
ncbi:hypothetical protein NEPTK9_001505 [Candidatus Neptunochlamydia vexilliferae]|uniref:2'-5' RNA ligase family protein n=1 Tax=Candidatus Neptunichlamydia vexilliferae TaxID=1651774 RepID=A0ABS0B0Q4_9BACT|nr:hypothetical protein [Candidatus Neptunochlamydia vexilliferae]